MSDATQSHPPMSVPPRFRPIYLLPLVVFAAISAYFLVGLGLDSRKLPSVLIGLPVPAFALPALEGAPPPVGVTGTIPGLAAEDFKGQVSLVNVFASWCGPCLVEHPLLMQLAQTQSVPILAINYKDQPQAANNWLRRFGNPYRRIGADIDGRVAIDFGVYGVPETFIVDREGVIRFKQVGPITESAMKNDILPCIEKLRNGRSCS